MEVGQTATAGHHYSKRWEEREPLYSTESWKDSGAINGTGRQRGVATSAQAWGDAATRTASSSTPSSLSSFRPLLHSDGVVDKVLYQNLVEMIPLVETLMDHHNNKSFPRHASLVYTPTPSRDTWMLKKTIDQKGKKGRSQVARGKRQDGFFWESVENVREDSHEPYAEEIPMLSFPTDHQADQNAVNKALIVQLQGQIEQLELRLQEKDGQLQQATENSAQQSDPLRLQTSVDELQEQISIKEQDVQKAQSQLSEKQHEVTSLQSRLQKAEADLEASNVNLARSQDNLHNLECQIAVFLQQMHSMSSCLGIDEQAVDEPAKTLESATESRDNEEVDWMIMTHEAQGLGGDHMEWMRRMYQASLIVARQKPMDEAFLLAAELRVQLQGYLMPPSLTRAPCGIGSGGTNSKLCP